MKWRDLNVIQQSLNADSIKSPQAIILQIILLVFIGNITGVIEFGANNLIGIGVHPSILSSSISNTDGAFSLPGLFRSSEFVILLLSGILLALFLPTLTPIAACILVVLLAIPPLYIGLTYPFRDSPVPMQYSLLVLMVMFGVNVLINYFQEARKKQQLVDIFGRYMPPEIADQLSSKSGLLNLDGESKELTVFFCDLINFTRLAEQLSPKQVVSLLNEYFTSMTEVLYKHGATIDKYMGDCVMAFWGDPIPHKDHARRCIMASFEIQKKVEALASSFEARGWPAPTVGIGANTGTMNVGNMGSKYRLAYTVIGDAVNLAFRFESLTRRYHVAVIVGEQTAKSIDDIIFRELDTVTVRGKSNTTAIYQPVCMQSDLTADMKLMLADHKIALKHYYEQKFELAEQQFSKLLADSGDPYYQHMASMAAGQDSV